MRMIEEYIEEASGGRDGEDWFEEEGCSESSKVKRWSASNCRRSQMNLVIFVKETIPDKI